MRAGGDSAGMHVGVNVVLKRCVLAVGRFTLVGHWRRAWTVMAREGKGISITAVLGVLLPIVRMLSVNGGKSGKVAPWNV